MPKTSYQKARARRKRPAPSPPSPEFQYPPLIQRRLIRLLRVSYRDDSNELHGSYKVVSLDSPRLVYRAISYYWDRSLPEQRVYFDTGSSCYVNGAAASALRWIARRYPNELTWLDQICMNQNDLDEKMQQIRLLTDIFSAAKVVIAWLGHADESSDQPISQAADAIQYMDAHCPAEKSMLEKLPVLGLPEAPLGPGRWICVRQLTERPYFRRLWCRQETASAADCLMVCGGAIDLMGLVHRVLHRNYRFG